MRHATLLLMLVTGGHAGAVPKQIHLSWQGATGSTMTVSWRSTASTGKVEYGASQAYGQTVTATSAAYQGSYIHQAQLTGLKPATTYHYRCGEAGDWSQDFDFGTAATSGSYRFAVYGDSRSNDAIRAQVRAAVFARRPAFSVHTGDFVYDGNVQSIWDTWFTTMQPLLAVSPLMGALGNHEQHAPNYYAQFAFPTHSPSTSGIEGEAYYSFNFDTTHFISLSTEHSPKVGDPQYKWLKQDLIDAAKDPKLRFTVAFAHRPPYSSGTHGNDIGVQQAWGHLFESFGVDLAFWGHDHTYERSKPLFQGQTVSKGGVVYIVTGGAGAPLYTAKGDFFTAKALKTYHFVEANVQGTQMKLDTRDVNNAVIDSLTLVKPPRPQWIMDGALDPNVQALGAGAGSELKSLHAGFDGRYLYVATQGTPAVRDHFFLVAAQAPTTMRAAPWKKSGKLWRAGAMLAMESSSGWSGWQDPAAGEVLVPFGSDWKYSDQGQDLGTAWLAGTYDDSQWPTGPAQLGYGDGDEKTTLTKASPNHPSVYFRKTLNLSEVPPAATLSVIHDDGVAVWINGQLVLSSYVDNGTGYAAWASSSSSDNEQTTLAIAQPHFKQGANVICAMVKQANATSSDLSFDLQLELGGAEQTGFSRASNPAGPVMEGLLDLQQRFGSIPSSVFLAAVAFGTKDSDALEDQIPAGNGNGDLETGEWVELKLTPNPPDGGVDGPASDGGPWIDAGPGADGPGLEPDGPSDDDGCSCALGGRPPPAGGLLLLLLVAGLVLRGSLLRR